MPDLEAPLENDTTARVNMTLAEMVMEVADPMTSRCLNALSIPLLSTTGKVDGLVKLHEYVAKPSTRLCDFWLKPDCFRSFCDSGHAEVACASSGADPLPHHQQIGRSFAIVSASGTIHTPHTDSNGVATFLLILEGLKYLVIGIYNGKSMPDFPDPRKEGLWSLLKMHGLTIVAFVAGGRDVV
jgi:hypothetical protein